MKEEIIQLSGRLILTNLNRLFITDTISHDDETYSYELVELKLPPLSEPKANDAALIN